jgi:hypothetical protein
VRGRLLEEKIEEQLVGERNATRGDHLSDRISAMDIRRVVHLPILHRAEGGRGLSSEEGEGGGGQTKVLTARLAWIAVIRTNGLTRAKGTIIPSRRGPMDLTVMSFT